MAKLSTEERNKLPDSDFALPGHRFPIHNEEHARLAVEMASRGTTPEEAETIRRKVHARYPDIEIGGEKKGRGKEAKNKTPAEAYGSGKKEERSEKKSSPKKKPMTSGEKFLKHFTG